MWLCSRVAVQHGGLRRLLSAFSFFLNCVLVILSLFSFSVLAQPPTGDGSPSSSSGGSDYVWTNHSGVPVLDNSYSLTTAYFRQNEAPNMALQLPFSFPFFGSSSSTVYLSPNGAIQLDNSLPCCTTCATQLSGVCCYFMDYALVTNTPLGPESSCSFALTYYNLIAPSLTDLSPATTGSIVYGYQTAAVTYAPRSNATQWNPAYPFIIQYRGVGLAQPYGGTTGSGVSPVGVAYTFGVGLWASGRIDFYYWNISDPALYDGWGSTRLWLVGLRPPSGVSQATSYIQQYIDPSTSTLPTNGTYVPRAWVVTNQTFSFWPFRPATCASPTHALETGGTITRIALKDYANSTNAFNWTCRFGDGGGHLIASTPAYYYAGDDELRCVDPPAAAGTVVTLGLAINNLTLPLSPLTLSYVNDSSPYALALAFRPNTTESLTLFCQTCTTFRPAVCWYDCAGTLHGTAVIDQCGTCVGGVTGRTYNQELDCLGVCFGSFVVQDGLCLCPSSAVCDALPHVTSYVSTASQYIYSLNSTLISGYPDAVIGFNDVRYAAVPYYVSPLSGLSIFTPEFAFPFFGQTYTYVYLNPSGAIFLSIPSSSSCTSHASLAVFDGSNYCQYNMIAGYLAEYDNLGLFQASYTYISLPSVFSIRFGYLHLAATPTNSTLISFSISIYPSGRVIVQHQSIIPPAQLATMTGLGYTRRVLIGVMTSPKSANDLQSIYPSPFFNATNVNGLYGLALENQWRPTTVSSGTFPPFGAIWYQGSVDFIPFGVNGCLAPFFGSSAGGQVIHLNPSLVSAYLPYLNLSCVISGVALHTTYNSTYDSYDCVLPFYSAPATLSIGLVDNQGSLITMNRLYYEALNPRSPLVQPTLYAQQYSTALLCGQCYNSALSINTAYCYLDCNYNWRGSAYHDGCGTCVGGLTGYPPNIAKDCYGTCYGHYNSVRVNTTTQCSCPLIGAYSALVSGCTVVPSLRPTPTVITQYVDTFNASVPFTAPQPVLPVQVGGSPVGLTAILLPFSFPFFGAAVREVYVDVDGAVYITNTTADCLAQGSLSLFTAAPNCLHQLIAGSLNPLNASGLPSYTSTTSYSVYATGVDLFFGSGVGSFTLSLRSDGSILLFFDDVVDQGTDWLVGVRHGIPASTLMPFPNIITASSYPQTCSPYTCVYTGLPTSLVTANELSFLPSATYTSGYYPQRALFSPGATGVLGFCPLSIYFCLTPTQGPSQGGTWVSFINNGTACDSDDCCLLRMNVSCNFGLVHTPAQYYRPFNVFRCQAPAGLPRTVVNVWLEESGRQIGMAAPLFFTYNDTAVQPVTGSDVEQVTCRDCGTLLSRYCTKDCTGTYRGNATYDSCGVCRPPANTTAVVMSSSVKTAASFAYVPVTDCLGVCYGPFTAYNQSALTMGGHADAAPQCGCTVGVEPVVLRGLIAFPYTVLCQVWQKVAGAVPLRQTIDSLKWYQVMVFVLAAVVLVVAASIESVKYLRYIRRRMRMTPAERARERRRMERRRQRERDRRERRRRLALGLPLPNQDVLPPGVAAVPVSPVGGGAAAGGTGLRQRLVAGAAEPVLAPSVVAAPVPVAPSAVAAGVVGGGSGAGSAAAAAPSAAAVGARLSSSESAALRQLHTMGFNDDAVLVPLIRRCKGDVNAAINQLLR